jgi:hypothetical protein
MPTAPPGSAQLFRRARVGRTAQYQSGGIARRPAGRQRAQRPVSRRPAGDSEHSAELSELIGGDDDSIGHADGVTAVERHWDELPRREQQILIMRSWGTSPRNRSPPAWASPRCMYPVCRPASWPGSATGSTASPRTAPTRAGNREGCRVFPLGLSSSQHPPFLGASGHQQDRATTRDG